MPHSSINRVTLVGNLTHDPELRTLSSGRNVCHIRVACNGRRRNVDGSYDSKPNYFSVSVFGSTAENAHRYLRKGRPVAVDGRLEWSEWETTDQEKRQAVTIVADTVQFLGGAEEGDNQYTTLSEGPYEEEDESELIAPGAGTDQEIGDEEQLIAASAEFDDEDDAELVAAGAASEDEDEDETELVAASAGPDEEDDFIF
jgi:single-strand DNA-binding protein